MFDWFWEFLYGLIKVPLFCIDVIIMVAQKLCGVEPVQIEKEVNGEVFTEDIDLLSYFMQGETILNAFGYVTLFAFILLFLFTAFRIVRDQVSFYEKKSPVRICLDSAKILLMFLLVPAIMIASSVFVSTLMSGIYEATANDNSGLGGSMFVIFADEAYTGPLENKQAVLDEFRSCSLEDYLKGTSEFSYYNTEKVSEFFSLSKFNFFLGLVGSISVVILLGLTLLSFVERIISLVLLFIIAPLPMSASPLDDGERFKTWREQTINKFITAYGGVLALNVFALMLPMIARINFFPIAGAGSNLVNGIARLLFLIGGAFACRRGMVLIGNLVARGAGSQDLMDQSHLSGGMATLGHMVGKVAKGTLGAVVTGAKIGASGVQSAYRAATAQGGLIQKIRQSSAEREQTARDAEADRFSANPSPERRQNADALQLAMRGGVQSASPAASVAPTVQAPATNGGGGSVANHEKSDATNKEAQNDIKSALQNTKSPKGDDEAHKAYERRSDQ